MDGQEERRKGILYQVTERAVSAVSFDRLLVAGMLISLFLIITLSAVLAWKEGTKLAEVVIGIYKDLALTLTGALANSIRHKLDGDK